MPKLEEYIKKLPPDMESEVKDFIEFLLEKRGLKQKNKLNLKWAGALKDYRDKYTSLNLQKKSIEWREE